MPASNQAALIQAAVRRDNGALEQLLQLHRGVLLAYISMHLPARLAIDMEAQDVLQDVLCDVVRRIDSFREDGCDAFPRWLVTVARNVIIDHLRRAKTAKRGGDHRRVVSVPVESDDPDPMVNLMDRFASYRRSPSQSAAAHEMIAYIERTVERLPEDYRQVVELRHFQGLTVKEAAGIMGRTENALQVLCSRALKALRIELGPILNMT